MAAKHPSSSRGKLLDEWERLTALVEMAENNRGTKPRELVVLWRQLAGLFNELRAPPGIREHPACGTGSYKAVGLGRPTRPRPMRSRPKTVASNEISF